MEDCIFCKISSGGLNTDFLLEDDFCVAFKDINPKAPVHILIVSKAHIPSVLAMTDDDEGLVGHLIGVSRLLAERLGVKGYRLQINVSSEGGQEIFHLHVHLLANSLV